MSQQGEAILSRVDHCWHRLARAIPYVRGQGLGALVLRSAVGTSAVQMASIVLTFLVGVQLARTLGVTGYGVYGIALAILTTAGIPAEMGLSKLVMREVGSSDALGKPAEIVGVLRWGEKVATRISLTIAAALILAAIVLAQLGSTALSLALIAGAPVIPLLALARVDGGCLQALRHIVKGQVAAGLFRPLVMSVLLFGLYVAGTDMQPWMGMATYSVAAAVVWLVTFSWLRARLPKNVAAAPVAHSRRWLSSMVPLALTDGMRAMQSQLSVLLLGLVATIQDVGLFRIAVTTALMVSTPQAIISAVTFPLISRLHTEGDHRRLQLLVSRSAQAQLMAVLLLSLPLFVAAEPIVSFVFGNDYAPAASVLKIVLVGQLITAAFGPDTAVLNMTHHERRVTRAVGIGLLLNAIAISAVVPIWGLVGGAIGYVVSIVSWNIIAWSDARRLVGIDTSFLGIHNQKEMN